MFSWLFIEIRHYESQEIARSTLLSDAVAAQRLPPNSGPFVSMFLHMCIDGLRWVESGVKLGEGIPPDLSPAPLV